MAILFHVLRDALQEGAHLPPEEAERIAVCALEWGAATGLAGTEYYWPVTVRAMPLKERNAAICKEFNGTNLKAVCAKYQVSASTVYAVIKPSA